MQKEHKKLASIREKLENEKEKIIEERKLIESERKSIESLRQSMSNTLQRFEDNDKLKKTRRRKIPRENSCNLPRRARLF